MSDSELIKSYINNGDKNALNCLLSEHLQKIYASCYRVCGNEQDASDITQNVIIKIIKNIKKFKQESKFSTWAYRIAYNESIDFLKKNNRYTQLNYEENLGDIESKNNYEDIDKQEMKTTLDSVLTRLNPLDKSIVLYFYYDNLKIREIAEILNENENTIKTRLKRVKIKLKNQLEHYEGIY